jgi:hypothetical protein
MSELPAADLALFRGGPPDKFQSWIGLIRDEDPLVALAIMWLLLVALAAVHGDLIGLGRWDSFLLMQSGTSSARCNHIVAGSVR